MKIKNRIESAATCRQLDKMAIEETGIPSLVLMEHAAMEIVHQLEKDYPDANRFTILCGPGNNGADGLAAARLLYEKGKTVSIYINPDKLSADEKIHFNACKNTRIPMYAIEEFKDPKADVIVDALFGSGLSREITGETADLIDRLNHLKKVPDDSFAIVSVDVPSGLNGDSGKILGKAVKPDRIYALDACKIGCLKEAGPALCRDISVLNITIPEMHHEASDMQMGFIDDEMAASLLKKRSDNSHKGTFGKVLLCGGSLAMSGAVHMAADACFYAGAGTTTIFTPEKAVVPLAAKGDLHMLLSGACNDRGYFVPKAAEDFKQYVNGYTSLALGNGAGNNEGTQALVKAALDINLPMVLDADGINALAGNLQWLKGRRNLVLTPHLKEFSRLSQIEMSELKKDVWKALDTFCSRFPDVTIVLKGEWMTIAKDNVRLVLDRPNSALAKGGSGDVLCGIITGLLAQGYSDLDGAILGAWLAAESASHGLRIPWCWSPLETISHLKYAFEKLLLLKENR